MEELLSISYGFSLAALNVFFSHLVKRLSLGKETVKFLTIYFGLSLFKLIVLCVLVWLIVLWLPVDIKTFLIAFVIFYGISIFLFAHLVNSLKG